MSTSQREHVDVLTTDLQLEVGRLRGELMVMRELVTELTEQLEATQEDVESALERTTRTIEITMNALRAAAEEPARPVRESFGGLPRKVRTVWRQKEQPRPKAPEEPADLG